jgi:hypothetical protein
MKKIFSLLILVCGCWLSSMAQDSLQAKSDEEVTVVKKQKLVKNTFRSTRIINMQSVEMGGKGYMQFLISHHFGNIWNEDGGAENIAQLFGLNSGIAHTYLSLDYSPINRLNLGFAATGNAAFEGWVKIKVLRQQTGSRKIPITIDWYSLANWDARKNVPDGSFGWNRISFLHQVLIARKFSNKFSLQLSPSMVHYNVIPYGLDNHNNIYSIGIGGKYALNDKKSITFEYSRQLNMFEKVIDKSGNIINYEPDLLALGMEFSTGGHNFQFYIGSTNSATNIEQLSRNSNRIFHGELALGFHLNRSFFLGKK